MHDDGCICQECQRRRERRKHEEFEKALNEQMEGWQRDLGHLFELLCPGYKAISKPVQLGGMKKK